MGWEVNATPQPLYPRERPGTYCIGGWTPRTVRTVAEKEAPNGIQSPDGSARSGLLYRLSYPGPLIVESTGKKIYSLERYYFEQLACRLLNKRRVVYYI